MPVEGDGSGFAVQLRGQLGALPEKRLMAQMHPVKKSKGKNSFFHNIMLQQNLVIARSESEQIMICCGLARNDILFCASDLEKALNS